ncbi:MAG: hypothetical protein K1X92_09035 [Bacteroidia bacterium]|nr:hypothetical protein [Bacteroidia bacterium]
MTVKQFFTQIIILHLAITAGAVIFLVMGLILGPVNPEADIPTLTKLFQTGILGLMLVNGGLIAFLFPRTKLQIENKSTLSEKLKAYRTWVIIRAALLEAVALFCGVGILLTGKQMLLVIGIGFIGFLIYFIPRREKVVREIEFTGEELQILANENAQFE